MGDNLSITNPMEPQSYGTPEVHYEKSLEEAGLRYKNQAVIHI